MGFLRKVSIPFKDFHIDAMHVSIHPLWSNKNIIDYLLYEGVSMWFKWSCRHFDIEYKSSNSLWKYPTTNTTSIVYQLLVCLNVPTKNKSIDRY